MSDIEALIDDFNNRDDEALARFHDLYYPQLCLYSYSYIDDLKEAKWIANGAFIKIYYGKKRNFKSMKEVKMYLYAIAKNDSIDFLRNEGKSKKDKLQLAWISSGESEIEDAAGMLEEEMARCERLMQLILNMPEMRKKVAILIFIEGKSARDAANILQIEESTVYSHKAAAKKEIFKAVGQHPFFDLPENEGAVD